MKKLLLLLSIVIGITYSSCKKNNDGLGEVYGKWKLVETLADPGDGSGKYIKTKEDLSLVLTKSGKVEGDAMLNTESFKVLDSVSIEFKNSNPAQTITYRYKVTNNSLWLYPPCIEGCGFHYTRK